MLAESAPARLAGLPADWLTPAAARLPGVAGACGVDGPLAAIDRGQDEWRAGFAASLHAARSICVVGNSGALIGAGLGEVIDQHELVVRFNVFRGPQTDVRDSGHRLDAWVASPNLATAPPADARWVIVSGPDVRYRLQNWDWLRPVLDQGRPVLTIPLEVWRQLVSQLAAPPSAGLLFLAWLRGLRGEWRGISAVGFGGAGAGPYHHAVRRQPAASRHHWEAERLVLQRWMAEGLALYGAAARMR